MRYRPVDVYTGKLIFDKKKSSDKDPLTQEEFLEKLKEGKK